MLAITPIGTPFIASALGALLFLGGLGLFGEQRVAVGLGDLVVVGMDFAECEEPVTVAAIFYESRLK